MTTQFTGTTALGRRDRQLFGVHAPLRRAAAILAGLFGAAIAQYRIRREIDELRSLSDATLKDIGVSRSEIASLVRANRTRSSGARHAGR